MESRLSALHRTNSNGLVRMRLFLNCVLADSVRHCRQSSETPATGKGSQLVYGSYGDLYYKYSGHGLQVVWILRLRIISRIPNRRPNSIETCLIITEARRLSSIINSIYSTICLYGYIIIRISLL